ncbi:MAG: hypothetical protein IJP80_07895 [Bacteroidales bacterium]|nr:hypothetical protein [Bacteroidales bacterium]
MKKIIILAAVALLSQSLLFAQNGKAVSDQDVPERYIKDFNRLVPDAKNVDWHLIDTLIYDAYFVNENGTKTSYRFSPKGTETRWFVEEKYYPRSIVQRVEVEHPGYKIKELYTLMIKNKVTYQVLVGQRKGLFVKKWRHMRLMNFETDGKFIDEIEM